MADRTFVHWPFFSNEHRALYDRALSTGATLSTSGDPSNAVRTNVVELARRGLLETLRTLDVRSVCLVREALAYHDALADFAFAMQGLASAPVTLFGSAGQREDLLPDLFRGSAIGAFALSEREAGSDVAATTCSARRDGETYSIDGEKTWISNAGIANVYITFARTSDDGARGLSAFIVPAESQGLNVAQQIETISPHPLGTLRFDRVRVPERARIGQEGEGFKIAMATLDVFRTSVGAAALGFARRALDEAVEHAKKRRLFGETLAAMQLTQATLADIATRIDAGALLVYRAAWTKDSGAARVTREAAMAKWYATEAAGFAADRVVQLFGGRGVTRGEIAERLYRDVRALRIYEGASEIQQMVIARALLA